LVEFGFCMVFLMPVLLGTFSIGLSLGRSIQASQISRDAGHMYARYVDFSLPGNQDIIVRLARGMGMTRNGGNGVVILSRITFVSQDDCAGSALSPGQCTNADQHVVIHRIVIGNQQLRASAFGTPNPATINADGSINAPVYLTDLNARANGFGTLLRLEPGEFAYVAEAFFPSNDLAVPGLQNGGVYARTIY